MPVSREEEDRLARRLLAALTSSLSSVRRRLRRSGLGRLLGGQPRIEIPVALDTVWTPAAADLQRTLTRVLLDGMVLGAGPRLDPLSDPAVGWARTESARLVREITDQQRQAIQQVITRAMNGELTVRQAAHTLMETVGLTARQEAQVAAYRATLLARETRLPDARIQTLTDRYRTRILRQRTALIARTETIAALNHGQFALWQASESATDPGFRKVWLIADDERTCAVCRDLDGQERRLNETFASTRGWIGQHPPAHPACRCTLVTVRARVRRSA